MQRAVPLTRTVSRFAVDKECTMRSFQIEKRLIRNHVFFFIYSTQYMRFYVIVGWKLDISLLKRISNISWLYVALELQKEKKKIDGRSIEPTLHDARLSAHHGTLFIRRLPLLFRRAKQTFGHAITANGFATVLSWSEKLFITCILLRARVCVWICMWIYSVFYIY